MVGNVTRRLVLVGLVAQGASCSSPSCNSHCRDLIEVVGHLATAPMDVADASLTLCVNSACTHGTLGTPPSAISLSGDFPAEVQIASEGSGTTVSVGFGGSSGTHRDGDSYHLQIVSASGVSLLDATRSVTYTTVDDGCGGPACSELSLDLYP